MEFFLKTLFLILIILYKRRKTQFFFGTCYRYLVKSTCASCLFPAKNKQICISSFFQVNNVIKKNKYHIFQNITLWSTLFTRLQNFLYVYYSLISHFMVLFLFSFFYLYYGQLLFAFIIIYKSSAYGV